jgi:hypothetical protein
LLRRFILGDQSCLFIIIENLNFKKPSFGPSKWPQKLKTAKNSKLPKFPENYFELVKKGGWPPDIHLDQTNTLEFKDQRNQEATMQL